MKDFLVCQDIEALLNRWVGNWQLLLFI